MPPGTASLTSQAEAGLTTRVRCGPCKMIAPKFKELADRYPQANFVKCDVDEAKDVAGAFGVRAM
jgi:thioredoxin-like negative regulator of GroEL